jgi:hypothetical protein
MNWLVVSTSVLLQTGGIVFQEQGFSNEQNGELSVTKYKDVILS